MKKYKNYKVSGNGDVYNKHGHKMKVHNRGKYPRVAIQNDGVREDVAVHRLVGKLYIPNPENKPEINHKNGNKFDNRVSNLEWSTRKENVRHSYKMGLNHTGVNHHKSKLTNENCKYIRDSNKTIVELGRMFGVHHGTISRVKRNKTYKT